MTRLCPLGHRVRIEHDGRGQCGTCRETFPESALIPVRGKVTKRNWPIYARAYRLGFQEGRRRERRPTSWPKEVAS